MREEIPKLVRFDELEFDCDRTLLSNIRNISKICSSAARIRTIHFTWAKQRKNKTKSAQKVKTRNVSVKQGGRRQEVGKRKFQNEVKNDRMNNLQGKNIKEKKTLIIIKDEERYS